MYARHERAGDSGTYGIEASPQLISTVTDAVLEEVSRWQRRPLQSLSIGGSLIRDKHGQNRFAVKFGIYSLGIPSGCCIERAQS
jgi:hypothetical protein